jgi:hypothetical protein
MHTISNYIRQHHLALVALFFALGGGVAWAADTIGSADIIDGEVKTLDIGQNQVRSGDIGGGQVQSTDVADDTTSNALTGTDIAADSLGTADVAGLAGADINDNSLKGADVDESSLAASRIVARPRGTASGQFGDGVVTSTASQRVAFPLGQNTWTQAANEIEREVIGEVTFSHAYACGGDPSVDDPSWLYITLISDLFQPWGEETIALRLHGGAQYEKRVFSTELENFEPGVATPRTLTAELSDGCLSGHVHVKALKLDVVGIR